MPTAPTPVTLTMFEVTGSWLSVSNPSLTGNNTGPNIEDIQGLVTFTPRLPKGAAFFLNDYRVSVETNTLQQVFLIGNPTVGTWRLTLDGIRTVDLTFSSSPAQVQTAIEALPSVGAGNVRVTAGKSADSFNVEFINALKNKSVTPLNAYSNLFNAQGQGCPIEITILHQGTPEVIGEVAVVLPAITGRIRRGRLCTIDSVDSPGVELTANIPQLNNRDALVYDVNFTKVSFNGYDQVLAPFAFLAPSDSTGVCLTSPELQRLPYMQPIANTWTPGTTAARSNNWRLRAV